ncbi:hypothetical protein QTP88_009355 [Uroleucon formosanum]
MYFCNDHFGYSINFITCIISANIFYYLFILLLVIYCSISQMKGIPIHLQAITNTLSMKTLYRYPFNGYLSMIRRA